MNNQKDNKWLATLTDWSIVLYPDIYKATESSETVFAKINCGLPVALFGRLKNDPRYDAEKGDAFADGHRLITSPIISFKDGKYHTQDSIYTLYESDKNLDFKKWCEDNQYKAIPLDGVLKKNVDQSNMLLLHICENCNKQEVLRRGQHSEDFPRT